MSTSVSPAKTVHSTNFSILTITRGRYNKARSGRSAEWIQYGLHSQYSNKKIISDSFIISSAVLHVMRMLKKSAEVLKRTKERY
jgi:hypothetical protein